MDPTAEVETFTRQDVAEWIQDWISDWFGLFDIAVGIVTFTVYYPRTQLWFFRKCGR